MAAFTIFAIASGISAAVSGAQSIRAGNAEKRAGAAAQRAANSEADLADVNAAVADTQAADALARGQLEESRFDEGVTSILGAQRAAYAGGNVDVNSGTALDVKRDAERLAELDRITIRTNAVREAQGYRVEAADLRARARIARQTGVYAAEAGKARAGLQYLNAAQTGLQTTTSLLDAKYGHKWRN